MPAILPNILVVDDNETITLMIASALTKSGFNVVTAADGLEGIKKFDKYNFDLVITDNAMPKLDGTGVARLFSNRPLRASLCELRPDKPLKTPSTPRKTL